MHLNIGFSDIGTYYRLTEKNQAPLWLALMELVVSRCDGLSYSGNLDLDNQNGIVYHSTAK